MRGREIGGALYNEDISPPLLTHRTQASFIEILSVCSFLAQNGEALGTHQHHSNTRITRSANLNPFRKNPTTLSRQINIYSLLLSKRVRGCHSTPSCLVGALAAYRMRNDKRSLPFNNYIFDAFQQQNPFHKRFFFVSLSRFFDVHEEPFEAQTF